ncbi:MAG: methyltransferase MtaB domain-containing protein [Candidatus Neomarinimicrobiota bacterium]
MSDTISLGELAISSQSDLIFGKSPKQVQCGRGVEIGAGLVLPEINFTLPPLIIDEGSWTTVQEHYAEMIAGVCQRAVDLQALSLVVEFELLPPMTLRPEWGAEITGQLTEALDDFHKKYGLRSALRATPVDVRDNQRPPRMRSGELLEHTLRSCELCARAGADLLSIESTGGKELHDKALVQADLAGIAFALGVLAVRDMDFLWAQMVEIARRAGILPAGDTACAFANTAMILAGKGMIPKTLAAVVRVASVVRSLGAYRQGAVGPSKDCAYEGPYLKAMVGIPISMEGKSSACAHLSSVGNIASACCDLWSNESVQNVRLLSTEAPTVSMEQLIYDCRLMNAALADGVPAARQFQRWLVESDARYDPQAYVLRPDCVLEISKALIEESQPLGMVLRAMDLTLKVLRRAQNEGALQMAEVEMSWLNRLSRQLESIPSDVDELWHYVKSQYGEQCVVWEDYQLE